MPGLKRVVSALTDGTLDDQGSGLFAALRSSLLEGEPGQRDPYYVLGDFAAYREARDRMIRATADRQDWHRSCWRNIVRSGRFSSDRSMLDYNRDIWHLEPKPLSTQDLEENPHDPV